MPNRRYVKFTGKFPDLIPNGWQFWKAFANNYRVYSWRKTEHGQGLNIWQHLGGYLEIADLFGDSYLIVEAIKNGDLDKIVSGRKHNQYWLVFNLVDNTFHDQFTHIPHKQAKETELYQLGRSDKEFDANLSRAYYDKWRPFNLLGSTVEKIKELLDKGWIVVEDDKRKSN